MLEKYSDPKKMFKAMDRDGGGSLGTFFPPSKALFMEQLLLMPGAHKTNAVARIDRKELAMGLFALEIWLHPKELQCLLDILDEVRFSAPAHNICSVHSISATAGRAVLSLTVASSLQDGGGDIDFDEFKNFWDAYNFEVAV